MSKRHRRAKRERCELCGKLVPIQFLTPTFGGFGCHKCMKADLVLKTCPRCEEEKSSEDFGTRKKRGTLKSWCKDCRNKYNAKLRSRPGYKEKHAKDMREWRAKQKKKS